MADEPKIEPKIEPKVEPPVAPDLAALQAKVAAQDAELAKVRAEAADRRVAAKTAEEQKAAAEKSKAEAEGRWTDVVKLQREETAKAAADAEAARKRVSELEPYEAHAKSKIESLRKALGDKAPPALIGVAPHVELTVLEHAASLAAGPGAVRTTTTTAPAVQHSTTDLSTMTAEQVRALSPKDSKALYERLTNASRTAF